MPAKTRRDTVVFIVGPTAIGKTSLAIKLAPLIHGHIISADSMQIYKGMKILSQAPTAEERKKVRHCLVEKIDPAKEYSAAAFIKEASKIINSLCRRKITPIVAGGSGFYITALIDGLFPSPKADMKFRKKMEAYASKNGSSNLHKKLAHIDLESAFLIHPNDTRRIIRALEIYHLTGKTMTELKDRTEGISGLYDIKVFGLTASRDRIYENIEERIDEMFKKGIAKEVSSLMKKRLSKTAKAILGFKEISGYLKGEHDLDTAKSLLKKNTRHFAKRQLTWFRADDRIKWFDVGRMSEAKIVKAMCRELKG